MRVVNNHRIKRNEEIVNNVRRHKPDYVLLILATILLVIGLITIYSISPGLAASTGVNSNYYVTKQLIAIGLGLVGFMVVFKFPLDFWKTHLNKLIILSVIAALATRVIGQRVNGAYRWVQLGGFSFQAVELIKFTILIWAAAFLAKQIKEKKIKDFSSTLKPILIALGVIGVMVAGVQSDLGSTGVMVAMLAAMVFVAGVPLKKVALIGGIVVVGLVIAIASSSYRQQRLLTFLHPTQDCSTTGTGYQACQAMIAVGSGGLFGKGLGRSVQDYGYLPEADNDSIFAVYAEQFGFLGAGLLLALYLGFFRRFKLIMERAPSNYHRLIVVGVLAWLSSQALINIGAMAGLLPLKGITLPLISYGGTSIVFVMLAIGLVFNISQYTTGRAVEGIEDNMGSSNEDITMRRRHRRSYYAYSSRSK